MKLTPGPISPIGPIVPGGPAGPCGKTEAPTKRLRVVSKLGQTPLKVTVKEKNVKRNKNQAKSVDLWR